jgi:hypothetical protein
MFKSFTWAKFLADVTVVVGIATSPLVLGLAGAKTAGIITGIAVAVRAIASLFTTTQAGTATNAAGVTIASK